MPPHSDDEISKAILEQRKRIEQQREEIDRQTAEISRMFDIPKEAEDTAESEDKINISIYQISSIKLKSKL